MLTFRNPNKWSIAAVGVFLAILGRGTAQAIVFTDLQALENGQVDPGEYSGVVSLVSPVGGCSGSLLPGGLHILTAAHCLDGADSSNTEVTFNLSARQVVRAVKDLFIFPEYKSTDKYFNHDVAVLKLAEAAPAEAEQYDIYRSQNEIGRTFTKVGYGYTGIGTEGQNEDSNSDNSAYFGQNRFDALGENFYGNLVVPNSQLLYDFDNGMRERNVFPPSNGLSNLGLGNKEVNIAPGDSGGPAFIGNLVAGISSYGGITKFDLDFNLDRPPNSTFGEISSDARVSFYASFIDAAVAGEVPSTTSVPEPSLTLGTFAFGAWGASSLLRRSKKRKSA